MKENRTLLGLLTDNQNWMARMFNRRASPLGLTRPQWRVLSGLNGNPGITQTELSELVAIARSPLGKIIDKLEANGWVERRSDSDDRRINRLYITKDVSPLNLSSRRVSTELEDELLESFTAKERAELHRLLHKLYLVSREKTIKKPTAKPKDSAKTGLASKHLRHLRLRSGSPGNSGFLSRLSLQPYSPDNPHNNPKTRIARSKPATSCPRPIRSWFTPWPSRT